MSNENISGTIKINWVISEKAAGLTDKDWSGLEGKRLARFCDRIADIVTGALPQTVDLYVDGEKKAPVRVFFEVMDDDIEVDEGPVNGMLPDLRADAE